MRKVVVSWVFCGMWYVVCGLYGIEVEYPAPVQSTTTNLLYLVVYTCDLEVGGGVHGPPYFVTTIKVRCMLTQKVAERARYSHRRRHISTKF
jgi:hypothetical protein